MGDYYLFVFGTVGIVGSYVVLSAALILLGVLVCCAFCCCACCLPKSHGVIRYCETFVENVTCYRFCCMKNPLWGDCGDPPASQSYFAYERSVFDGEKETPCVGYCGCCYKVSKYISVCFSPCVIVFFCILFVIFMTACQVTGNFPLSDGTAEGFLVVGVFCGVLFLCCLCCAVGEELFLKKFSSKCPTKKWCSLCCCSQFLCVALVLYMFQRFQIAIKFVLPQELFMLAVGNATGSINQDETETVYLLDNEQKRKDFTPREQTSANDILSKAKVSLDNLRQVCFSPIDESKRESILADFATLQNNRSLLRKMKCGRQFCRRLDALVIQSFSNVHGCSFSIKELKKIMKTRIPASLISWNSKHLVLKQLEKYSIIAFTNRGKVYFQIEIDEKVRKNTEFFAQWITQDEKRSELIHIRSEKLKIVESIIQRRNLEHERRTKEECIVLEDFNLKFFQKREDLYCSTEDLILRSTFKKIEIYTNLIQRRKKEHWKRLMDGKERRIVAFLKNNKINVSDKKLCVYEKNIGTGSYGIVNEFVIKGRSYAVKQIPAVFFRSGRVSIDDFKKEVCTIVSVHHHPNIAKLEYYCDKEDFVSFVFELCQTDLHQYMIAKKGTIGFKEKIRILLDIAKGMEVLHMNGIIHRDLKLENILLLKNGTAKICDFGISSFAREAMTHRTVSFLGTNMKGSPFYIAPELLNMSEAFSSHSKKIDVYSFGILSYIFLFDLTYSQLQKNFYSLNEMQSFVKKEGVLPSFVKERRLPRIDKSWITKKRQTLIELMQKCYSYDRSERPNFVEVVRILKTIGVQK